MLQKLSIHNYAIIDELSIAFHEHLNIITGETGAGKSIIMGALGLILGQRADSSALRNKEKKCFVEGIFAINNKQVVKKFLVEAELDADDNELVIRREINAAGKSRAFINDTPVTLQTLKQLATLLVDLHQQFDTAEVADSFFQQTVVDALANNQLLLPSYQEAYKQWQQAQQQLQQLIQQKNNFQKEYDYNQFLFDELQHAGFTDNELENAEQELGLLSNVESIKTQLSKAYFLLKEGEQPINSSIKQLIQQFNHINSFHPSIENIAQRLQSSYVELQDIATEIDTINENTQYDAERIQFLNDRLTIGYKLLKKHNVSTTNELLAIQQQLSNQLTAVLQIDDAIATATKQEKEYLQQATQLANTIAANRKQQIVSIQTNVQQLLQQVGMPNAAIQVVIHNTSLNPYGCNEVAFLFDANKRNQFEPIAKVASGGELSRLMLCIKSLIADTIDLPTMIFDEIDTGISGEAAKQVGVIMKNMAAKRQIICITHQPQIAGKAHAHFFVYKQIKNDAVVTNMKLLNQNERITAIAQMLSGEQPTAAAVENAKEMVMN